MRTQTRKIKSPDTASVFPLGSDEVEDCRNSLLFSHRALGTGVAILDMTDAEFREALHDDYRFVLICEIYKLLAVDSAYAQSQAEMRELVMERIVHGLVERQHPATEILLTSPIDFDVLPDAPGMSARQVNAPRPSARDHVPASLQ